MLLAAKMLPKKSAKEGFTMAAQWQEVYRQVAQKLQHLAENAPTPFWASVFAEAQKRWNSRQEIIDGKIGSEITIYLNAADEATAAKMLSRLSEFAQHFDGLATDAVAVKFLSQKYNRNGKIAVLLRLRLVQKSSNRSRSKFVAHNADEI
jgi:hypothetical protein